MTVLIKNNYDELLNSYEDETPNESDLTLFDEKKPNWDQSLENTEAPYRSKENAFENGIKNSDHMLFLAENEKQVSYANIDLLTVFLAPYGEILPRIETRLSLKKQRQIAKAIRRARAHGFIACTYR